MSGSDERTVKSLRELPPALEPGRDLWPQIEARLKVSPGVSTATQSAAAARARVAALRWLAAAAMVSCVAVGVWVGRDLVPVGTPGAAAVPTAGSTTAATPLSEGAAVDAAYVSDPRYRHQRAELMKSVQARLEAMPEPARAKVAASLAAIETAKKDLESALGKDPSNALLQELLINTYQDEMRVLTDVHEIGDPSRGI
jgi:hypothetical protein